MEAVIALLRDLVAIDSVNPSLVAGARGEQEIGRRLAEEMIDIGLDVEFTEVEPGRPNVVGVLNGRRPGRTLMFCGHSDTVGVTGMDRPFVPDLREGRLYGRGSQDMKGGLAAMIDAARRIATGGGLDAGTLVVAAVIDEEHASRGAEALVSRWHADAAVLTEPTALDVAVAHKGFQWVTVETRGRAAHGSRPLEGVDAIMRMGRVLAGLELLDARLQSQPPHPLLGTPSLHASLIHGGHELSSYPARASLQFERRSLPGEPTDIALREIETLLQSLRAEDREFDAEAQLMFAREGYEISTAEMLPAFMCSAAVSVGCTPALVGMTFWTDAAILARAGIPSVVFGPGGAGLHGADEYVLVDDVIRCRDALTALARSFTAA